MYSVPDGPAAPTASALPSTEEMRYTLQEKTRSCYVCKGRYVQLDSFYDQLCPPCAALGKAKRAATAPMQGRIAIVTGGRVRIGRQITLSLLRCGAHVVVTTRFPQTALAAFTNVSATAMCKSAYTENT